MNSKKEQQKHQAARTAVDYIKEGMTIGLGSGTTSHYLIQEAGKKYAEGLHFYGIATSRESEQLAASLGIPLLDPEQTGKIHLAIDGVDEIDKDFRAVKGGGGALLREKIIASWAEEVIWIMDESKLVERLGTFPFPVEAVPFGMPFVKQKIADMGAVPVLRMREDRPYLTDSGNYILDIKFLQDTDISLAAEWIHNMPGVVETGYFGQMRSRIVVGTESGVKVMENPI
ncbi:ribose-5-phosphate isomerase RpiA [Blautia sp.]|uniref:ribose-5-phosphate isomerase RpiA n=1 Tax=Blautia sp. TaxID=1955243 RepID=UPI0025876855|nr:ribose-5-phosphate isomerase RpiA [Blautia sp.]